MLTTSLGHTSRLVLVSARARPAFGRSMASHGGGKKSLWDTWFVIEAVPIYAVVVLAVGGAGWYLTRLARGPDVIWDRHNNPTPWLNVQQDENTKLWSVNQKFEKSHSRDRL